MGVDLVFSVGGEVVGFFDVLRVFAFRDSDHPQELVDVVAGVADHGAEDDQDVGSAFRMRKGMKMRKIGTITVV